MCKYKSVQWVNTCLGQESWSCSIKIKGMKITNNLESLLLYIWTESQESSKVMLIPITHELLLWMH